MIEKNGVKVKQFYGMSSATAMQKHAGGVAEYRYILFLAALAALYLTLVSHSVTDSVTHRHFRILTQRVTFET